MFREPELKQHVVTDYKGAFTVAASPDATFVVVKKAGLSPAWKTWLADRSESSDPLVLSTPTTISGVVLDENDQPVAEADVCVSSATIQTGESWSSDQNDIFGKPARECFSARTAADGRFRIKNFPANGHAALTVTKPGFAQRATANESIGSQNFLSGQQNIILKLGLAGAIEGKVVVQETGRPVRDVEVWLLASTGAGGTHGPVKSSSDGSFRIPDLQPASYNVWAVVPGQPLPDWTPMPEYDLAAVTAGKTNRDVLIHVTPGVLVEVKVVSTNVLEPLANVAVSSGRLTAYTDTNGLALLRMTPGKSWFSASKQDWLPQQTTAEIKSGHINHVRIELTPPPHITGIVRDPSGASAPGVLVAFHPGQYQLSARFPEFTTDENGRYEITLRQESRLFFSWDGPIGPTNYIMARDLGRNLAAIQEFAVVPTNLDLNLQPGITISGFVKDTEGTPISSAVVELRILSGHSIAKVMEKPIKVDGQGSFSIPAMLQGREYSIYGTIAKGYGTGFGRVKAEDTKTNRYEFPTFVLKRADRILAGQVLGVDGTPVAEFPVRFYGQGQRERSPTIKSDNNGRFMFDGVCEGTVTVTADYENTSGNTPAQGGDTNVVVRLGITLVQYRTNFLTGPLKLTGTVRDPSGTPADGATVSLFPLFVRDATVQTGNDGRYEINWQARLANEETHWLLARDLKRGFATFHQVAEKMTNLDLNLQDGVTLSTEVSDTDGQVITNATATLTIWEGTRGYGVKPPPLPADDSGNLRIPGLPQGHKYWVQIEAPGYNYASVYAEATDTKTNFLKLPPAILELTDRDISGQVLDVDGKPAASIALQLFATGTTAKTTTTDSGGHFFFNKVKRGSVSISVGLPVNGVAPNYRGSASAKGGDTNILIRLGPYNNRFLSGVSVTTSGTVFDPSGAPAPGVLLAMLPSGGLRSPIQSDANGKYTLQWKTTFIRTNSSTKAVTFARDPDHNLAATGEMDVTTTNLDLHLQPGLTLSGAGFSRQASDQCDRATRRLSFQRPDIHVEYDAADQRQPARCVLHQRASARVAL
jgi:protocatechuate 3,4-dioxygenase beta subunit